jgi:hypothetical protein
MCPLLGIVLDIVIFAVSLAYRLVEPWTARAHLTADLAAEHALMFWCARLPNALLQFGAGVIGGFEDVGHGLSYAFPFLRAFNSASVKYRSGH